MIQHLWSKTVVTCLLSVKEIFSQSEYQVSIRIHILATSTSKSKEKYEFCEIGFHPHSDALSVFLKIFIIFYENFCCDISLIKHNFKTVELYILGTCLAHPMHLINLNFEFTLPGMLYLSCSRHKSKLYRATVKTDS